MCARKSATYYYFAAWRDDGTDRQIHELLRCQVRERNRRLEDPTLVILDPQSVRVATRVPADTTGRDAAKRVPGRKRGLPVDVIGLVIAVTVLAASVHDNTAGITLLDQIAVTAGGSVSKALVDQGFKNQVVTHGAALGIDVVRSNPEERGFVPQAKRWRVKQPFGILILHRRLVRDYEHRPASSASRVYCAKTQAMARRLTDTNTLTWRDPQVAGAWTLPPPPGTRPSGRRRPGPGRRSPHPDRRLADPTPRGRTPSGTPRHHRPRRPNPGPERRPGKKSGAAEHPDYPPASPPSSTTPPAHCGPETSARPSASNSCRNTSNAPAPG